MTVTCKPARLASRGFAACVLLLSLLVSLPVLADVNPEMANCEELKDPITLDQSLLCSAHVGCRFVLGIQRACSGVKRFLGQVSAAADAAGQGLRNLLSREPQRAADVLFAASLTDSTRRIDRLPETQATRSALQEGLRRPSANEISMGAPSAGSVDPAWVYYGEMKSGRPEGWGTGIRSNGMIIRGEFTNGSMTSGQGDRLLPNGTRHTGLFIDGKLAQGAFASADGGILFAGTLEDGKPSQGRLELPNGWRFEGRFNGGKPGYGKVFRPDGTLAEEGQYDDKQVLSLGRRFAADGKTVVASVDVPGARQRAENRAQAQQQQEFNQQLEALNPGELLALWDRLAAQGNAAGARQALRALVRRFPDHPLAEGAALRLAGIGVLAANTPADTAGRSPSTSTARSAASAGTCQQVYAAKDKELGQRRQPTQPVPLYRHIMWMLEELMGTVRSQCTGAERDELLKELQRTYKDTEQACNGFASQPCTAAAY